MLNLVREACNGMQWWWSSPTGQRDTTNCIAFGGLGVREIQLVCGEEEEIDGAVTWRLHPRPCVAQRHRGRHIKRGMGGRSLKRTEGSVGSFPVRFTVFEKDKNILFSVYHNIKYTTMRGRNNFSDSGVSIFTLWKMNKNQTSRHPSELWADIRSFVSVSQEIRKSGCSHVRTQQHTHSQ